MKPKTSKYHNWDEGDCGKPIRVGCYYKKGFWKRYDRKKYYRNLFKREPLLEPSNLKISVEIKRPCLSLSRVQ